MGAPKKPGLISVGKDKYRATVLRVLQKDIEGRPWKVEFVHDEKTVMLEGGEEFIIVYVHEQSLKRKKPS